MSVTDSDPTTVRSTVLGPTQQHADPGPFTQNFILTKSTEPFIQADIWATRTAWPKSMRRRLAGRPLRVLRLVKGRGGKENRVPMPNAKHLPSLAAFVSKQHECHSLQPKRLRRHGDQDVLQGDVPMASQMKHIQTFQAP